MPIQPPEGLRAEVLRVAEQLLPSRIAAIGTSWALDESDATIDVELVMPMYAIGIDAIAEGRGPESATHVGWRSIVTVASRAVAMADASAEDPPQVESMNYGPYVAGLTEAAQVLDRRRERREVDQKEPGPGGPSVEQRVLLVSALYLTGIWLHGEADPERDEVIPAAPAPPGIAANEPVRLVDLLESLAETARIRLADPDDAST